MRSQLRKDQAPTARSAVLNEGMRGLSPHSLISGWFQFDDDVIVVGESQDFRLVWRGNYFQAGLADSRSHRVFVEWRDLDAVVIEAGFFAGHNFLQADSRIRFELNPQPIGIRLPRCLDIRSIHEVIVWKRFLNVGDMQQNVVNAEWLH